MKRILIILSALITQISANAQTTSKMNYQAVVRNLNGDLISTGPIGMRISILQGSPSGTAVYTETQTPVTNDNGLATMVIGNGTVVSGNLSAINWANGPYFIKTETDPTGGTNYTISGTSELMSVPYARYAETSGTAGPMGPQGIQGTQGPIGLQGLQGNDGITIKVNNVQQVNGNVTLTKSDLGLPNVDNTSDLNKPVATSTQNALNLKANLNSPTFTGMPMVPTATPGTNNNQIASTYFVTDAIDNASTPDATASVKGKIALGGDLAGTGSTSVAPVISANAINTTKLANSSVTTSKIADDNVTTAKISDNKG